MKDEGTEERKRKNKMKAAEEEKIFSEKIRNEFRRKRKGKREGIKILGLHYTTKQSKPFTLVNETKMNRRDFTRKN